MSAYILLLLLLSPFSVGHSNIFSFEGTDVLVSPVITLSSSEESFEGFNFEATLIYPEINIVNLRWRFVDFVGAEFTQSNKLTVNVTREPPMATWMQFNISALFTAETTLSFINITIFAIIDGNYSTNFNASIHTPSPDPSYVDPLCTSPWVLGTVGGVGLIFFVTVVVVFVRRNK